MNGEKMVAGEYVAHVVITTENDGKWTWEQNFEITNEEADKFNQEDVSLLQESRVDWSLIIIVVASALGIILIIFFAVRFLRKKNQKKTKKKKKSSKKKR